MGTLEQKAQAGTAWGARQLTGQSGRPPARFGPPLAEPPGRLSLGLAGVAGSAPHPGSERVPPRRRTRSPLCAPTPPGKWSSGAGLVVGASQGPKGQLPVTGDR